MFLLHFFQISIPFTGKTTFSFDPRFDFRCCNWATVQFGSTTEYSSSSIVVLLSLESAHTQTHTHTHTHTNAHTQKHACANTTQPSQKKKTNETPDDKQIVLFLYISPPPPTTTTNNNNNDDDDDELRKTLSSYSQTHTHTHNTFRPADRPTRITRDRDRERTGNCFRFCGTIDFLLLSSSSSPRPLHDATQIQTKSSS